MFDKNDDGYIDRCELVTALRDLGMNPTKCEIDEMIAEADSLSTGM